MKRKARDKERLLEEISDRVIEADQKAKEAAASAEEERSHLDALEDVTDLPRKTIERIAADVKKRAASTEGDSGRKRIGRARIVVTAVLLAALGVGVAWLVARGAAAVAEIRADYVAAERLAALAEKYGELVKACEAGNLDMAMHLHEEGAPLDIEGWRDESALMAAVGEGHAAVAEWLIAEGAKVAYRDEHGVRASDIAFEGDKIAVRAIVGNAMADAAGEGSPVAKLWALKILYAKGAFIDRVERGGLAETRLFLEADSGDFAHDWERDGIVAAARAGNVAIIELFFAPGRDAASSADASSSVNAAAFADAGLLEAARAGKVAALDFFLDRGADINYRDETSTSSNTPLAAAVENRHDTAKRLLERGADPDKAAGSDAMPPIFYAIMNADYHQWVKLAGDQVRLLVRHGADVDARDGQGRRPIEQARRLRFDAGAEIVGILKAAGAEIPFTEESFRYLVYENDAKNVRSFLERGADPDLSGFYNYEPDRTALIEATRLGFAAVAAALLENGADPNYRTSYYKITALLLAVRNENVELTRLLLKHGATVTDDVRAVVRGYSYAGYPPQDAIRALILK